MTVRPPPRRGIYEEPFWFHVAQKRLHLQRCAECGQMWYPPGPGCPGCLSDRYEWAPAEGTGQVLSWAVFHRQYFESLPPPYTIVAAALEEGPILIADLVGDLEGISVGQTVELCYDLAQTPEGGDFTIYHWRLGTQTGEG